MLHACFVYIPAFLMCTFIQYLAFSGTNLLIRCHSASSCFLLFLCFRKVIQEIFSELHGTKTQHLRIPSLSYNHKGICRGATGWPEHPQARAQVWARRGCVWAPLAASDS